MNSKKVSVTLERSDMTGLYFVHVTYKSDNPFMNFDNSLIGRVYNDGYGKWEFALSGKHEILLTGFVGDDYWTDFAEDAIAAYIEQLDAKPVKAVEVDSNELNLNITAISAMRLGLVLERAAVELCGGGDEQFLCDVAITWAQLFTMYGRAKSVELYMPDDDVRSYRGDIQAYRLGYFPKAGKNGTPQHHSTTNGVTK